MLRMGVEETTTDGVRAGPVGRERLSVRRRYAAATCHLGRSTECSIYWRR
jgi:hypothetical protein